MGRGWPTALAERPKPYVSDEDQRAAAVALTRRLNAQARLEARERESRLSMGIRDESWGGPWWLAAAP